MTTNVQETPWGSWEVLLDAPYTKVKRIIVKPTHRLSYQRHKQREEVWTIVQGYAVVTLNDSEKAYKPGDVIRIPKGASHRIKCMGEADLIFIEVQMGTYFGEDDIERLADDYGR